MRPPEAAIVDLVLPDGDGIELTRRLREWSEMPILVLSAVGEEEQKVRALEAGADDYITKPFGTRELVARLQAALRRAGRGEEEPTIAADGLEIDLAARVVRRDGEPVHLTPIEFDLLRALARNRGRLMTHRKLLVEVWGPEYVDDIQPLRTHIARLRAKIEPEAASGAPRYIVTDPGVGYRFAAERPWTGRGRHEIVMRGAARFVMRGRDGDATHSAAHGRRRNRARDRDVRGPAAR